MPIYEYRCAACGFEKEYLQKLSDPPITGCERCGQAPMIKLISAAGFHLKGSGWYVTDFKNNGAKSENPAAKGKDDAKPDASSGDVKSDAGVKPSGSDTAAKSSSDGKSSVESGTTTAPASSTPAP